MLFKIIWGIVRMSLCLAVNTPSVLTDQLPALEAATSSEIVRTNSNALHAVRKSFHHHHVVPLAWISLTLSRHFSLSFIASGRSSGLHPVSSHSCRRYVLAGCPAFARPYVGVHRNTSLMSSSLLLQQCPVSLVRLTWIVFMMGGRWPYSWCFMGCCHQDLFNIARSILI